MLQHVNIIVLQSELLVYNNTLTDWLYNTNDNKHSYIHGIHIIHGTIEHLFGFSSKRIKVREVGDKFKNGVSTSIFHILSRRVKSFSTK
jgi:hypothetical protein